MTAATIEAQNPSPTAREALLARGPSALSTSDLLTVVLGANGRLAPGDRAEILKSMSVEEVRHSFGVGPAKAAVLVAAVELGRRLYGSGGEPRPRIRRPEDVFAHLPKDQLDTGQECFFAFYLDSRGGLISVRAISKGSADLCIAHPREVFKTAVREGACKVVVVHNHPSGVLEPSKEDLDLTQRLLECGRILGIPLVDHVIVSNAGRAMSVLPGLPRPAEKKADAPQVADSDGWWWS